MLYDSFKELCNKLGDQNLSENDRWKSLKYINLSGQATPGFDFQRLLKEKRISFVNNDTDVGAGFVIIDAPNSDMGVTNLQDPIISFIPLSEVISVTFIVTKESTDPTGEISINEITEDISGITDYDIPVNIIFKNSIFYFKKGEPFKFALHFSRTLTSDDYEISYQDENGNDLNEKPVNVGVYYVLIKCKNGFSGEGKCKFEIVN